jgi:hypothetical protein
VRPNAAKKPAPAGWKPRIETDSAQPSDPKAARNTLGQQSVQAEGQTNSPSLYTRLELILNLSYPGTYPIPPAAPVAPLLKACSTPERSPSEAAFKSCSSAKRDMVVLLP